MAEIAFLGTGLMGAPMARNLLAAGHDVTVWNRSREKTVGLGEAGAVIADTADNAVTGADVVISMLADGDVTGAIIGGAQVGAALGTGAIWVDMCSARPDQARAQAELLATQGVHHIDAPVSGGTKGAEDGTLAIMAGGSAEDFEAVRLVLAAMGRPVHVGPTGTGQLAKLANQAIVAAAIGAVAEAMLLVSRGGGDPDAVRSALKGGFADSSVLQQHGARMSEGNFTPGGFARLHLKDLTNALSEADDIGLKLPMTGDLKNRFQRLCDDLGGGALDHSALYLELMNLNGLGGEAL